MPKWRNWQTRTFEGRVRQLVGVRVPPSAPRILKILSKNADFRSLGTTKVQTPVVWSGLLLILIQVKAA